MAVRLVEGGHGRATRPAGPPALAVEPTRELALQTARAFAPLKRVAGLRSACVYGGVDRAEQVALLQHLPHALVATPGRCGPLTPSPPNAHRSVRSATQQPCSTSQHLKRLHGDKGRQTVRCRCMHGEPPKWIPDGVKPDRVSPTCF